MFTNKTIWITTAAVAFLLNARVFGQHDEDIVVGQSAGRVALHPAGMAPGTEYLELLRVDTFLVGWSNNEPGFESASDVEGGVAPLSHGHEIWLDVVHLDPALYVIDNAFNVLEFPGDAAFLGGHDLHTHVTFFVDETDPQFDAGQCVWEGVFLLVEDGSSLNDSEPFSMLFTNASVRHEEDDPANGDFDLDQSVGPRDRMAFTVCLSGPGSRPAPAHPAVTTCEVDCYNSFDFDDDLDVDLEDFADFQRVSGAH